MNEIQTTRARRLQVQLYSRFGYGYVSRVARGVGFTREYVSRVLNGQEPGVEALDKIEAWLKEQEEEHPHTKPAA